jgi:antitoxin component of RelBE/YafQ-DinJ toxin-antitoxin module
MNITLSVDEKTVEKARRVAQAMGKSLNQVVREYLEQLGGKADIEAELAELRELSLKSAGRSGGRKFNREEIYDRPVFRRK